ncbi:uncharacterized protein N7483_011286 [Penicillium malachiteum]|uniref:uncharacterized protein n=1 Tax=Penicillium malachiteum TaxID=1324776 RepID=UPI002549ADEB|nr:uncharacterized protein N7483_011286 [Penicillium malachiteum]KAJ5714105.1 hypothetical protein N7483_011286 [Penicillium malachiteum]
MAHQSKRTILLLGTCDTKLAELLYTKSTLESQNTTVLLMDLGWTATSNPEISITQQTILHSIPDSDPNSKITNLNSLTREAYIKTITAPAIRTVTDLFKEFFIHGILGIGGSCGTALSTSIMRDAVPIGFPKLMVSTMASGDVAPYIGETDIGMIYSIVDIAGRNRVLDMVLGNAVGAITGMARTYMERQRFHSLELETKKTRIGITMFGVTTPGVTAAKEHLTKVFGEKCEIFIFHATGSGGRAMERLIKEGQIDAVLDLTTTEIADEVVGGVLSAGENRLRAATERNLPRIVSVGACDMVNFGPAETVPPAFSDQGAKRLLYRHNPTVTIVRTTKEECVEIGKLIARNLIGNCGENNGVGCRTKVVLPVGGISLLDALGQAFWDPEADEALFSTLEDGLAGTHIEIIRDQHNVNDPEFAIRVVDMLCDLIKDCK